MCLDNSSLQVKKLLGTKRKFIYCWKILNSSFSPIFCTYYTIGLNKSNSKAKGPRLKNKEITRGIHVFRDLTTSYSRFFGMDNKKVVRVKCYLKDLIGCNLKEACFTKVYIEKKEGKKHGLR